MQLHAKWALLPDGWAENVALEVEGGAIGAVRPGAAPRGETLDVLIPGTCNLHSHAFQRGFAGLTEARGPGRDSFWTWREMMYRFALQLDPDGAQAIAEMAYVEMLEAGFTRVGEFHYLHHAPDGRAYDDPAEMSARIFAAAEAAGIALTHLPVFYAHGGFGPAPASDGQRRFLHDRDAFLALVARCDAMARPGDVVGYAPHSLRAADAADLAALAEALPGRKVHIHVAEQIPEVDDCLAFCGRRPVQRLFDVAEVGPDWCLIHATHLLDEEVTQIAGSGATVGLCPVTEANLGDGIFPAQTFLAQGGRFGVGTDSNVRIGLADELRCLEYGQRLTAHERNALATAPGSTGTQLLRRAQEGGARALGAPDGGLVPGAPADLVALRDPLELGSDGAQTVDRWLFGPDIAVGDVWVAGRRQVREGRHVARDRIADRFARTVRQVLHDG
ncbi:MAG: formimidoylglutamate deiminase [Rhodobacteraceae bacterium]|jgi:formimidoylglutamate deiminase|uniref:Formimidoylglutamate deiminase n=1 Tax=Salipiger profundus TaxID=1229727 RepID=A0A1U7D4L2_9RHOB|nr:MULTISPECIES: formimidoylglutamate deiminase [Salipiger]APX23010.1 formimidoylglutamate deiminase [Salipiger profundus]MAB04673.1 formimidoylglutamate deiminase [Paracoccaceae bacterium]GGA12674.1 formimidoylglutamate deiminase [Salipiger profundus]SFD21427.1 formimidoylglutamate deiminase [Salipiger profundus]